MLWAQKQERTHSKMRTAKIRPKALKRLVVAVGGFALASACAAPPEIGSGPVDGVLSRVRTLISGPLIADGNDEALVEIGLLDVEGRPVRNQTIHVSVTGLDNHIEPLVPKTDQFGIATVRISTTRAETKELVIVPNLTPDQAPLDNAPSLQFEPGPIDLAASSISASPATELPSDGEHAANITVTLVDTQDNRISGVDLTLEVIGPGANIVQATAPTNIDGESYGEVTSTRSGNKIVRATVNIDGVRERLLDVAHVSFISPSECLDLTEVRSKIITAQTFLSRHTEPEMPYLMNQQGVMAKTLRPVTPNSTDLPTEAGEALDQFLAIRASVNAYRATGNAVFKNLAHSLAEASGVLSHARGLSPQPTACH